MLEKLEMRTVSILGFAIAGFTHFFRDQTFLRPMRDIPALDLNVLHLLFEGQHLPSLYSKKLIHTTKFLCKSHTCTLLSIEANLQFDRVTSLYKFD